MKKFIYSCIFLGLSSLAYSNPVPAGKAHNIALTFYGLASGQTLKPADVKLLTIKKESDNSVDFYIYNVTTGLQKGFVIVSGDDVSTPVIGYSTEGNFSTHHISAVSDWLADAASQVHFAVTNGLKANAEINQKWKKYDQPDELSSGNKKSSIKVVVKPLLKCTWNQEPYYNANCPANCPCGCVATAMGQIMKFWGYPAMGTGSYSYTDGKNGKLSANFGATTYKWGSMPNSINSSNSQIATLLFQLGVSVAMQYSSSGSGAWVLQSDNPGGPCAQQAYVNYFGYYASTIKGVKKISYGKTEWVNLLETELNALRPIEYVGQGNEGGHTWVVDGYESNNYFHMNWGWGGLDNGYFTVSDLNPSGIPLGQYQEALYGIQPIPPSLDREVISAQEKISVFPTFADERLNVSYTGDANKTFSIIVMNSVGSVVSTLNNQCLSNGYGMDVSNFESGNYFVIFIENDNSNRFTAKFVKK